MKIIKDNYKVYKDNYHKARRITCRRCKSIIEVSVDDLKNDPDRDAYIKCPLCGYYYYIKPSAFHI